MATEYTNIIIDNWVRLSLSSGKRIFCRDLYTEIAKYHRLISLFGALWTPKIFLFQLRCTNNSDEIRWEKLKQFIFVNLNIFKYQIINIDKESTIALSFKSVVSKKFLSESYENRQILIHIIIDKYDNDNITLQNAYNMLNNKMELYLFIHYIEIKDYSGYYEANVVDRDYTGHHKTWIQPELVPNHDGVYHKYRTVLKLIEIIPLFADENKSIIYWYLKIEYISTDKSRWSRPKFIRNLHVIVTEKS